MLKHNKSINRFNHLSAVYKLIFALTFSMIILAIEYAFHIQMEWMSRLILSWDTFSMAMVTFSLITFFTMKSRQIQILVKDQDSGRTVVFFIILIASCISLGGIINLLLNKENWILNKYIVTAINLSAVIFSWLLLHIVFTFRYAHIYYEDVHENPNKKYRALDIPDEPYPDYLDFAYFSFVIGMTFQVSDINIHHKRIRRLALLHGILSFMFNTVIVALSINVIIDLK